MNTSIHDSWSKGQVFVLLVAIFFFGLLSIPFNPTLCADISRKVLSVESFYQLTTYHTSFFREAQQIGLQLTGYLNWLIALVVALCGSALLQVLYKQPLPADRLYYILRVLLRYRLAIALFATGIVKLFPVMLPLPTLSDLHTEYGDFLPWKVYFLSTSISSAGYVPTLGLMEIGAALLLLFRKTTVIGAAIAFCLLLNIVLANYAYGIGEQVYSSFLLLLSFAILWYDLPRLYALLFLERYTKADTYEPVYKERYLKFRKGLKIAVVIWVLILLGGTYRIWSNERYPYSNQAGLKDAAGYYEVTRFVRNADTIAYSQDDEVRWRNVIFEKWNTLSIRDNNAGVVDSTRPKIVYQVDSLRNFEQLGNGGRHFYRYEIRDGGRRIELQNKIVKGDRFVFHVKQSGKDQLVLSGVSNAKDSLQVVLQRTSKEYLLHKGRRKPIKIY
ncbi:beta-carotene 15,15'-monooxygenase [Sphingobacterium sp. SYP-B4668]|uniref:beta-carotene 15,15'-monooxygenase n=1 Tax=Sphingobacterium sp. SYP-B4668 TaxID=2996035 RepID=UPI0022DCE521|nr:beta-carotene 15,15'-monooxygenase [Sphingobacterium sp. SYP-B4668]